MKMEKAKISQSQNAIFSCGGICTHHKVPAQETLQKATFTAAPSS